MSILKRKKRWAWVIGWMIVGVLQVVQYEDLTDVTHENSDDVFYES